MGAQQAIDKVNRIIRETQSKAGARSLRIPINGRTAAAKREHGLIMELDERAYRLQRSKMAEEAAIERAALQAQADRASRAHTAQSADSVR